MRHKRHSRRPVLEQLEQMLLLSTTPLQGGTPNYFGPEPNWAYSPTSIQKFADSLSGVYVASSTGNAATNAANRVAKSNDLGQSIPVGIKDTTTYPGSDYYEIGLVQYTERMNSSLNPTTLRGYVQIETPANAGLGPAGFLFDSSRVPGPHDRGHERYAGAREVHQLPAHWLGW